MANFYPINTPLVNYFFYNEPTTQAGPNIPLEEGYIYFYADEDHSVELPTFSDVSDPNNPVVNENPLRLGAAGECPLFYLEDRLYYIIIEDKDGETIRTISHYHPTGGGGSSGSSTDVPNYIPNGQFLLHNDLLQTPEYDAGEIREDVTEIAPGNWTFVRTPGTVSKNYVTFTRYDQYDNNPPANPRFSIHLSCQDFDSGDSVKDLRLKYENVNRFASSTGQKYTISFFGIDNIATNVNLQLYLIKNFGTGGSTQTETLLTTFNITPIETQFTYSFTFGDNSDKTLGELNDDFVELALRLPLDTGYDVNLVNFSQKLGSISAPPYPELTKQEDVYNTLGGSFPVPDYEGMNLGLTPILTKNGFRYDDSMVGMIMFTGLSTTPNGWLMLDGTSYAYDGFSVDGVPYRRVADKYWNPTILSYQTNTGTGYQFVNCQLSDVTPQNNAQMRISTNQPGAYAAATDGAIPTGFTFSPVATGGTYGMTGCYASSTDIWIKTNTLGATNFSIGDSGFLIYIYKDYAAGYGLARLNLNGVVASSLAGKYFICGTAASSDYVWFKYNGTGSDPAPGGTGILVNLYDGFDGSEILKAIAEAVSGKTNSEILFTSATTITPGSYFTFSTSLDDFYVYYVKGGIGNDPALANKIGIEVQIAETAAASDVCTATITSINKKYFGVHDPRGLDFRIWNNGANMDPESANRFALFSNLTGDKVGTMQWDSFQDHTHYFSPESFPTPNYSLVTVGGNSIGNGADFNDGLYDFPSLSGNTSGTSDIVSGVESRGANIYLNALIKY